MDDYNVNVLSEAKNEYSCRLVSILTPVIIEGIKSIFKEAEDLCIKNDEDDKYLMTFQNFLQRVPKWNSSMIDESKRIIRVTDYNYLEDLVMRSYYTSQILTSVRVSQNKKIDIDIKLFFYSSCLSNSLEKFIKMFIFEKDNFHCNIKKTWEMEIICQKFLTQLEHPIPVDKI